MTSGRAVAASCPLRRLRSRLELQPSSGPGISTPRCLAGWPEIAPAQPFVAPLLRPHPFAQTCLVRAPICAVGGWSRHGSASPTRAEGPGNAAATLPPAAQAPAPRDGASQPCSDPTSTGSSLLAASPPSPPRFFPQRVEAPVFAHPIRSYVARLPIASKRLVDGDATSTTKAGTTPDLVRARRPLRHARRHVHIRVGLHQHAASGVRAQCSGREHCVSPASQHVEPNSHAPVLQQSSVQL